MGEILLNIIASFNEKIKIDNEIFKIKYNSLFSRDYKIFDQNENVVFKSDISKKDLFIMEVRKKYSLIRIMDGLIIL